jgi:hypothetical protein
MTRNEMLLHRRVLLASVGRAGGLLTAASLLRAGAGILAPAAALLPGRVCGQTGDLLVQPAEIRSQIEAVVIGPPAGEYPVRTIPFQNQAWKAPAPAQQIAMIVSSGAPAPAQTNDAEIMGQRVQGARWIDEIRAAPIARRRTLNYSRTDDRKIFMIDGHVMVENRIDQTVMLGTRRNGRSSTRTSNIIASISIRRPSS